MNMAETAMFQAETGSGATGGSDRMASLFVSATLLIAGIVDSWPCQCVPASRNRCKEVKIDGADAVGGKYNESR